MVLTELWFAFLPERGTVAGGLGVHPVFGQPGNYEVPPGLLISFLQPSIKQKTWCRLCVCVVWWGRPGKCVMGRKKSEDTANKLMYSHRKPHVYLMIGNPNVILRQKHR